MGVLGVIGDASADNSGFGRYEVKRLWQWRVEFYPAFDGSDLSSLLTENVQKSLTTAAKNVSHPKVTFSEVMLKHANEQWKIAGKTNWASEDLTIIFDDVIPNAGSDTGDAEPLYSAAAILHEWQNTIQSIITGNSGLSKHYKANVVVTQFNPEGTPVERWIYHGAWPKDTGGEAWDYENEDGGQKITVAFSYDKCFRAASADGNIVPPAEVIGTDEEETIG
jgi:hypothetical protein